jgi:death-on-curing protein
VIAEPIWIEKPEVLIVHSMQLAQHGGTNGIRDISLLDSALAKPKNVYVYGDKVTLPRLAASYAFGIARNHPFLDGNKRTALVVCEGFLRLNGLAIVAPPEEKYLTFLGLAAGRVPEEELTDWLANHAIPLDYEQRK